MVELTLAERSINALVETKRAVLSVDGSIHPAVAILALTLIAEILGTQRNRTGVKTKEAIVALLDAMKEDIGQ